MKALFHSAIIIAIFFSALISTSNAQEWSAEQKEVWASVEAYWDLSTKGDAEAFLSYFHDSFTGWVNNTDFPHNKADRETFIRYFFPKTSTAIYTITPAAIWVQGNFAFVHYFYTEVEVNQDGKEEFNSGRWTDILMKDGDRWVMVGDHGGETSGN